MMVMRSLEFRFRSPLLVPQRQNEQGNDTGHQHDQSRTNTIA